MKPTGHFFAGGHRRFLVVDFYFCAIILVIVSFLFAFSCGYPILEAWDDDIFVLQVIPRLKFTFSHIGYFFSHSVYNNYVPLAMFSYMLDYNLWGANGLGYHLQSLVWHLMAVYGIYVCFRFFKLSPLAALLLTLIFAVHPQRVESVVWISERRDVMCGAFYFWSFFLYMRSGAKKGFPFLSLVFFVCALLSKAAAVTLPAVLVLYEIHRAKSFFAFKRFWKTIPFFILSIAIIIVTAFSCSKWGGEYGLRERFLIVAYNYAWYFEKNLWPGSMSPIYPNVFISPANIFNTVLFYVLTPSALLGVFFLNRRYFIYRLFLVLCAYSVTLSPVIGVFRVASGAFDYADRYSYIPAFFFLLGAACLIELLNAQIKTPLFYFVKTGHFRNMLFFLISCSIICLAVVSYYYAKTWQNYKALITCASMHKPPNWMALSALAIYHSREKNYEMMEDCADEILAIKGIVSPKDRIGARIMGYYLKGTFMRLSGREDRELECFEKAAAYACKISEPHKGVYARLFSMMSESYLRNGDKTKAIAVCDYGLLCLGEKPSSDHWFLLGNKLMISGRFKEAEKAFAKAHALAPESKMVLKNLKKAGKLSER